MFQLIKYVSENKETCKEQYTQLESQLEEQRQLILQGQTDHNEFINQQQLKEQQQDLILQRHEEQLQQQQQLLMQQEQQLNQLKETITQHLQQSPKSCTRPDLEEISRKELLTPRAKKCYERTISFSIKKREKTSKEMYETNCIQNINAM